MKSLLFIFAFGFTVSAWSHEHHHHHDHEHRIFHLVSSEEAAGVRKEVQGELEEFFEALGAHTALTPSQYFFIGDNSVRQMDSARVALLLQQSMPDALGLTDCHHCHGKSASYQSLWGKLRKGMARRVKQARAFFSGEQLAQDVCDDSEGLLTYGQKTLKDLYRYRREIAITSAHKALQYGAEKGVAVTGLIALTWPVYTSITEYLESLALGPLHAVCHISQIGYFYCLNALANTKDFAENAIFYQFRQLSFRERASLLKNYLKEMWRHRRLVRRTILQDAVWSELKILTRSNFTKEYGHSLDDQSRLAGRISKGLLWSDLAARMEIGSGEKIHLNHLDSDPYQADVDFILSENGEIMEKLHRSLTLIESLTIVKDIIGANILLGHLAGDLKSAHALSFTRHISSLQSSLNRLRFHLVMKVIAANKGDAQSIRTILGEFFGTLEAIYHESLLPEASLSLELKDRIKKVRSEVSRISGRPKIDFSGLINCFQREKREDTDDDDDHPNGAQKTPPALPYYPKDEAQQRHITDQLSTRSEVSAHFLSLSEKEQELVVKTSFAALLGTSIVLLEPRFKRMATRSLQSFSSGGMRLAKFLLVIPGVNMVLALAEVMWPTSLNASVIETAPFSREGVRAWLSVSDVEARYYLEQVPELARFYLILEQELAVKGKHVVRF